MRNSSESAPGRIRHRARALELHALVDEQRRVTAVVEQHVRAALGPGERLLGAPPVLLERLALPGEDRDPLGLVRRAVRPDRDRRGGVILGREDVARAPAHLRAERDQRLDEHRRLDRHVQRAGDPSTTQRLLVGVLTTCRHQAGHLVLGEADLLPAPFGQGQIGHLEVQGRNLTHFGLGHANLLVSVGSRIASPRASRRPSRPRRRNADGRRRRAARRGRSASCSAGTPGRTGRS